MTPEKLDWRLKPANVVSAVEIHAILQLRSAVFVVEQHCVFQDIDGLDLKPDNWHLMAWRDGELAGCLRLLAPINHNGDAVIGRVITSTSARGVGLGHELMRRAVEACATLWPNRPIALSAQAHLAAFYAQHDFVEYGDPYFEDGIPHLGMRRAG